MTSTASFKNTMAKLAIGSLDDTRISIAAHYNPKELAASRNVPWSAAGHSSNAFDIEYTGSQPKTMELEMLFDCFEEDGDMTVQQQLDTLEVLAEPRNPESDEADERRPHYCVVTWGEKGMHPLRCVITSLTTKVTMFATDGTPRRAVANVKVQEVRFAKEDHSHDGGYTTQVSAAKQRASR